MDGWSRNDFLNSTVRFSNFEVIKNTKLNSNPILSLCVNREVLRYHPRRCHCQSRWISPPASKSWNTRHPHVLHIMIIVVKYICLSDCVRRRRTGGFCVSDGGRGIKINRHIPCGCWTTGRRTRSSQEKEDDGDDNCTTTNKQQRLNKWNIHLKWLGRRTVWMKPTRRHLTIDSRRRGAVVTKFDKTKMWTLPQNIDIMSNHLNGLFALFF